VARAILKHILKQPLTISAYPDIITFMRLSDAQTVFNALADPTRFRILNLLSEVELCVCDIMKVLREPQSKISRHLAYLKKSGLVAVRKEGLWVYYSLAPQKAKSSKAILGSLTCCRSDFEELRKDLEVLEKVKNKLVACC